MDLEEEFYEGLYEDGTEEQPIVLEDPKAQVYLPIATTKTKGIASFDAKDFNVSPTGKVALNEDLHQIKENTDTALEKSQEALTNSEEALNTANTALNTANGIDGKATEALTNSEEALNTANTALNTANTALNTANTALNTANGIDGKATEALNTANTALNTANGIDGKATEALSTAAEALDQVLEGAGSKVYVNGVLQTSVNVNEDIQDQFDQLSGSVENVQDLVDQLTEEVEDVKEVVPSQASSQNPLADRNFVNSSINAIAAFYITYDSQGNPFPTKAALSSATTFYSAGVVRVPTRNDYCLVLADETHDNASCRYVYSGEYPNGQWDFQFVVNETPFTSDQIAAINSGITSALVQQISTLNNNKADRNNSEQSITTGNLTITGTLYIS